MGGKFGVIEGGRNGKSPTRAECSEIVRQIIARLLVDDCIAVDNIQQLNRALKEFSFELVDKKSEGLLPGGIQLFYRRANVIVRVKTIGTQMRPQSHMTISLSSNGLLDWKEEMGKYSRTAKLHPAALYNDSRVAEKRPRISVIETNLENSKQQLWADDCHFNFKEGFDCSGATELS